MKVFLRIYWFVYGWLFCHHCELTNDSNWFKWGDVLTYSQTGHKIIVLKRLSTDESCTIYKIAILENNY